MSGPVRFISFLVLLASSSCSPTASVPGINDETISAMLRSRPDSGQLTTAALRTLETPRLAATPHFESGDALAAWQASMRARLTDGVLIRREALPRASALAFDRGAPLEIDDVTLEPLSLVVGNGARIDTIHYVPRSKKPAPGVVLFEGHFGPPSVEGLATKSSQALAAHLARAGLHVLHVPMLGADAHDDQDRGSHEFAAVLTASGIPSSEPFIRAVLVAIQALRAQENVDTRRVGVLGLSGGGWQALLGAALDHDVAFGASLSGFSPATARLSFPRDSGDTEQAPWSMFTVADYDAVAALVAPRPFLFSYIEKDDCCFRPENVLPHLEPTLGHAWGLHGKKPEIVVDRDATSHMLGPSLRARVYQFIERSAGIRIPPEEKPLHLAAVPRVERKEAARTLFDVVTQLATSHATSISGRDAQGQRAQLRRVLALEDWVPRPTREAEQTHGTVHVRHVELALEPSPFLVRVATFTPSKPRGDHIVLVFADEGRASTTDLVRDALHRGFRVAAFDPLWIGAAAPPLKEHEIILATGAGVHPLALEVNEVRALLGHFTGSTKTLMVRGPRAQLIALAAAALDPTIAVEVQGAPLTSLHAAALELLDFPSAPEFYAPGLWEFEVIDLRALAATPMER